MKIMIEKNELERIAEDIQHEATMLDLADEESAAEDISFYVPMILDDVIKLKCLADDGQPAATGGVS